VLYHFARQFGDTSPSVLAAELLTAGAVFALPTFFMGAAFSHLAQLAREQCGRIGNVLALNTIGAALAPIVCSVALVPLIGASGTLTAVAVTYLALVFGLPQPRRSFTVTCTTLVFLLLAFKGSLRIVDTPEGGKVLSFREGVMASVAVIEDADKSRTLRVDNRFQMGGTASADAEYRQAHIPLLLHPAPRRALFLGVGTGISFGAASLYPELKSDGVELLPEVAEVMSSFESKNFSPLQQADLKLHIADARRFVRSSSAQYDVIIGDLFHPYRDGAGALYTREHFAAVRERLATNGLFCQWLPLHQFDAATLRVVVRTFLAEFPNAQAWLLRFNVNAPVLGLVGWNGEHSFQSNQIESRLTGPRLAGEIQRLALADSIRFFGHFVAGAENLRRFSDGAGLSTDDNPRVTFMAPRLSYQRDAKPYASLMALLEAVKTNNANEVSLSRSFRDAEFAHRLSTYIAARDIYLRGLILDVEGQRDEAFDAYIESARRSADFTSGYAQCLSAVSVIANSDPVRAKKILGRLVEAQPKRPVAKELLERLFPKE
jgi:spermidine synthase